jgi:hypothetical protein
VPEQTSDDDLTPRDEVGIANDDDLIVLTEATGHKAGPSEAHRRYLEKKYGPPIPRPKNQEKKDSAPPENKDKKDGDPPPA